MATARSVHLQTSLSSSRILPLSLLRTSSLSRSLRETKAAPQWGGLLKQVEFTVRAYEHGEDEELSCIVQPISLPGSKFRPLRDAHSQICLCAFMLPSGGDLRRERTIP